MAKRFLLYIDVLGFSDLVTEGSPRIHDLYEVIASLNAHKHSAFRAIVFSDTILVYNTDGGGTKPDRQYLVMFLCEFAQDLQYRLTKRGIFFRAVIVHGEFTHYELNSMPVFFGPALIDAYIAEKELPAIGLFMQKDVTVDSDIFYTEHFNEKFDFVLITQSLNTVEKLYGGIFPIDRGLLEDSDLIYHLAPELMYLEQVHRGMSEHMAEKIRIKYINTWELFCRHYPKTTKFLASVNFNWQAICPEADWAQVAARFPESYRWAIKERVEY